MKKNLLKRKNLKVTMLAIMLCIVLVSINVVKVSVDAVGETPVAEEVAGEVTELASAVDEETVEEESVKGETVKEEPVVEGSEKEEPVADESMKDEPVAEESEKDELVEEESEKDEPVAEEAEKDESVVEEEPIVANSVLETLAEDSADMKVVFPTEDMDPGATYGARFYITRYLNKINVPVTDSVYQLEFTYADEAESTTKAYKFTSVDNTTHGLVELTCDIENIPAGTTITVKGIVTSDVNSGYDSTKGGVTLVSSNASMAVSFANPQINPRELSNGENLFTASLTHNGDGDVAQIITNTKFEQQGGQYDLEYLLSHYNVISFKNIESTHIVGPIIAKEVATRTTTGVNADMSTWGGQLVASDYSKGASSYVGVLKAADYTMDTSALLLGYGFDIKYTENFTYPTFYIGEKDLDGEPIGLQKMVIYNENKEMVKLASGATFLSPNNVGYTSTLQNDEFIDFASLKKAMISQSQSLVTEGTIEGQVDVITIPSITSVDGVLDVKAGTSVVIEDASNLTRVNLIFPEGYDYYTDPYPYPTTISITDTTINPETMGGISYSRFPETYVNGAIVPGQQGQNGEFGELGSKIIWNLPNIVTDAETGNNRLATYGNGQNIVGHLVAPQAEFWNCDPSGAWEGGNINGTIIVANFKSGTAEMHMFPYFGDDEVTPESVSIIIDGQKTFTNGSIENNSFVFNMDYVGEAKGGYTTDFTLSDTTNSKGYIKFDTLHFTEAGDYVFHVYEDIPTDHAMTNVDYDHTVYEVTIEVTDGAKENDMAAKSIIKKIKNREGEDITPAEEVSEITFENIANQQEVFDHTFYKRDMNDRLLEGAEFTITEIVSETDETPVVDGYTATVISDEDGAIDIQDMKESACYKLVETKAPDGYATPSGYWILSVDDHGKITYTTKGTDVEDILQNVIRNDRKTNKPMDITLTKVDMLSSKIVLEGAKFTVERIVSFEDHTVVENGYSEEYISGEDGTFVIEGVQETYFYKLTETEAPVGYELAAGYWIIEVKEGATEYVITQFTSEGEEVMELTSDEITNVRVAFVLPDTGGMGRSNYYIAGLCILLGAALLYRRRVNKV